MVNYCLKHVRKAKLDHKAELPLQSWGIKASGFTVDQGIAGLFLDLCSSNPSQQAGLTLWHLATVSGSVQSVLPAPEKN